MRTNTMTATTTPTQVPAGQGDVVVIVNIGENTVYFGDTSSVSAANGVPLGTNIGYEFGRTLLDAGWSGVWVVTEAGSSEVRYTSVG